MKNKHTRGQAKGSPSFGSPKQGSLLLSELGIQVEEKSWAVESAYGQRPTCVLTVLLSTRGEKSHRCLLGIGHDIISPDTRLPCLPEKTYPCPCTVLALTSVGLGTLPEGNPRYWMPGVWPGEREVDGWLRSRMDSLKHGAWI